MEEQCAIEFDGEFCSRYYRSEPYYYGSRPCERCGGPPIPHFVEDAKSRIERRRVDRRNRVHVPRRPDDERIPSAVLARAADPLFGSVYRTLRLACPAEGCTGYAVLRKRRDRRFKFAGCSTYTETGCRATCEGWTYVVQKSAACEDILAGQPPRYPVRFVQPKPRAPKTAAAGF